MFSCEFCKIFKNIFSYGTAPVAASRHWEKHYMDKKHHGNVECKSSIHFKLFDLEVNCKINHFAVGSLHLPENFLETPM